MIWQYSHTVSSDSQLQTTRLLNECVILRDGFSEMQASFTVSDIRYIISYFCTS